MCCCWCCLGSFTWSLPSRISWKSFSYNSGITGRILISQVSSLYQHFEIFPSDHPFIGFSSLSKVLPLSHFSDRSGRIVLETTTPGFADLGGVYNTLFIGEAYANFGWWGVFNTPVDRFLIQSLHILFCVYLRRRCSWACLCSFLLRAILPAALTNIFIISSTCCWRSPSLLFG